MCDCKRPANRHNGATWDDENMLVRSLEAAKQRLEDGLTWKQQQGPLNSVAISRIAYGEFRSHARTSANASPGNLADAVTSVAAVCGRGNKCASVDGSGATGHDGHAWRNIRQAVGGRDLTGGGDLMCVGNGTCELVHSAYTWVNGRKTLVKRPRPLPLTGKVTIRGSARGDLTLHFYKLPYKGWLTRRDYLGPPKP